MQQDVRDGSKRFDVVDRGRPVVEPVGNGEGRAVSRKRMFSLQAVEQRSFFAADVGARAAPDTEAEPHSRAEDIVSDKSARFGCCNRAFEDVLDLGILVAEIDDAKFRAGRARSNDHPLDHCMRVMLQQCPVLEATRFAFVGIADHGLRGPVRFANCFPFCPRGKPRATASGQFAFRDEVDHLFRGEVFHRTGQPLISAGGAIAVKGGAARLADLGKYTFLHAARIRRGEGAGPGRQCRCVDADGYGVPLDDRHRFVTPPGARHGDGVAVLQGREDFAPALEAADRAGANARGVAAVRRAGEVMIEGDGPKEFRDGNVQSFGHLVQGFVGQGSIAVMKRMKDGK